MSASLGTPCLKPKDSNSSVRRSLSLRISSLIQLRSVLVRTLLVSMRCAASASGLSSSRSISIASISAVSLKAGSPPGLTTPPSVRIDSGWRRRVSE
ncbi:hypothetical protein D9M69_592980 [compost metagenome]